MLDYLKIAIGESDKKFIDTIHKIVKKKKKKIQLFTVF